MKTEILLVISLVSAILGISYFGGVFLSCAPKAAPVEKATLAESATRGPQTSIKEPWQIEWEKTLEGARKEGKAVVYGGPHGAAIREAIDLFQRKYGMALEVLSGRGVELARKILTERANGLFIADVFVAGPNTNIGEVKPTGAFEPLESALILSEVKDPKAWIWEKLPWVDKDRTAFAYLAYPVSAISINTEQVKPEEIKSYYDLLAPKWKERMTVNDPTVIGIGANTFSSLIWNKALELDFFRQLAQQKPLILRDQRLQVDWLARGKYPVAIWPQTGPLADYKKAGAPIYSLPTIKEGVQLGSGASAISLLNRAPHPNAAKIFINWLLSKEGQIHMQNYQRAQSARIDISIEMFDPMEIRMPGEKYLISTNSIEEWILHEQEQYLEMARQAFGPLLR